MTTFCGEPLPGPSDYFCCLAPNHDGWHKAGPVRWGGGSEVDDHHAEGGHG